jgi:AraC-like DNA-binding protein
MSPSSTCPARRWPGNCSSCTGPRRSCGCCPGRPRHPSTWAGLAFAEAERLGRAIAQSAPAESAGGRRLGLLLCLLAELADGLPPDTDDVAVDATVYQAASAMAADPAADWTVGALASSAHVSTGHFARNFRRRLGSAPMAWLAALRGERAAALLIETDLPTAEVGRLVGWADPNYASRRFRQLYGVATAAYRRMFGR